MTTVREVYDFLDSIAPFDTQCEWDNSGLLVGSMDAPVKKIYVCLDLTNEDFYSALKGECDLVITHHPVIFSPIKKLPFDSIIAKACKHSISVISVHTNFDAAKGGMNDILCKMLNLQNVTAFGENNLARIGEVGEFTDSDALVRLVKEKLSCGVVKYVGRKGTVHKVAVCAGSGGDFLEEALKLGADVLITGDTKHHQHIFANDNDILLIDAGHYATEAIFVLHILNLLGTRFSDTEISADLRCDPVKYI